MQGLVVFVLTFVTEGFRPSKEIIVKMIGCKCHWISTMSVMDAGSSIPITGAGIGAPVPVTPPGAYLLTIIQTFLTALQA